jgi:multisubunit Na+/H+ antiporter MnhE subunit
MTAATLRIIGLVAVYLLVLTSVAPGDVLIGAVLAVALTAATRWSLGSPTNGWRRWSRALAGTILSTAREMVIGTVRTVRFGLGGSAQPGFVEIPRDGRSPGAVALWGLLTGEAPDEYPVDVDDARDVLLVHVLDVRDPAAVRARHAAARERWQRGVIE